MSEDRNQHWDRCVANAKAHAEALYARVRSGEINGSAVYGLMRGFLEAPAYYPEWRGELLRLSVKDLAL